MNVKSIRRTVKEDLKATHKPVALLAQEIGISKDTLHTFLSGSRTTRYEQVRKIARHYGLIADSTSQNADQSKTPAMSGAGAQTR